MIRSSYLVKGQREFILMVKSQSKYLAGQHFDRGRRSEYRIYRSVTPLCNDAVPWLNEAKSRIFRFIVIVKNFQIHLYFVCHLPACHKTRFHYVCGSNFSHKECNWRLQYESVVPKKIYPLRPDDSLYPSLAFIVLL